MLLALPCLLMPLMPSLVRLTAPLLPLLLQVISLVCHLVGERQEARPFLIAVPSSLLPNWEAELKRWAPSLKASAHAGATWQCPLAAGLPMGQQMQVRPGSAWQGKVHCPTCACGLRCR